ncbi:hypothetical protein MPSI1_003926 [Malassezia psittaci]|uniref:Arrestin C-terminal-like domain-containing protein n=1 Tax=Malassezia psittaci TaxID=1821823 RepID=A0AAF0FIQ8_9BASI|nr:hypothetical protein MPSI1_003926 [Malassezia psittaci]
MAPPRIQLRPPPNRGFLQGYPGIPASETRPAAHLSGIIVVHANTPAVEAAWLRVEMAKIESLPTGESWTELIGEGPMDVWAAKGGLHVDGEAWAQLPAVRIDVSILVKSLTSSVPEEYEESQGAFRVKLYRNKEFYAPLDSIDIRLIVYSNSVDPAKLKGISLSVRQTVTYLPSSRNQISSNQGSNSVQQRSEVLAQKTKNIRKKLPPNEFMMFDLSVEVPKTRTLATTTTAKHIEITHSLRVAVEIGKECVVFERLKLQISSFMSSVSTSTMARIGNVPSLCLEPNSTTTHPTDPSMLQPRNTQLTNPPVPPTHSPQESRNRFEVYERLLVNGSDSIPQLQNDAMFLGTPTPRRPLVFQTDSSASPVDSPLPDSSKTPPRQRPASVMAQTTLMQLPSNFVRPGDLLPYEGGIASPSRPASRRTSMLRMPQDSPTSPRSNRFRAASPTFAEPIRVRRSGNTLSAQASPSHENRRPVSMMASYPVSSFPSAENEKSRLFEQARAEAERYQSGYEQGASFPALNEFIATQQGTQDPMPNLQPAAATSSQNALPSDNPTQSATNKQSLSSIGTYPSAADEKRNLYERAQQQVADFHRDDPSYVPSQASMAPVSSESLPPSAFRPASAIGPHPDSSNLSTSNRSALQPPLSLIPPADSSEPSAPSPYLTESEARAVDEKARLQQHFAQQEAAHASTQQASRPNSMATAPPRPPKVPLSNTE